MRNSLTKGILCIAAMLTACAPADQRSAKQEQLYHMIVDRPITCKSGRDCDAKWARATDWVMKHTVTYRDGRKVPHSLHRLTKNVIQGGAEPLETRFRIMRVPQEDGTYLIDYSSACEEDTQCFNSMGRKLRMSFVSTLIGLPPHVMHPSEYLFGIDPKYLPPQQAKAQP